LKLFVSPSKVALLYEGEETPYLQGYAAILVVHVKISLTINIALGETVTEFNAVVRTQ
jgi:hypothetical protein